MAKTQAPFQRLALTAGMAACAAFIAHSNNAIAQGNSLDGLHYWAVENLDADAVEQRGTSGGNGFIFNNLILAPRTEYRFWVLRAESLEVGYVTARTGRPGRRLTIPPVVITPANIYDTDGDGLPDIGEFILGTNAQNADTDADGVADGAEVRQGTDPLDGIAVRTGLIASVDTPGTAVDVCARDEVVVVADSQSGISVFNAFNGMDPRAIAQVDTSNAMRVACGSGRVAVAEGTSGLSIVDISDPASASVTNTISSAMLGGDVNAVAITGRIAYAGLKSNQVVSVDVVTGTILERVAVDEPVVDLFTGSMVLYVLTRTKLNTVLLEQPVLEVVSTVTSPTVSTAHTRVFAAEGVAYTVHGKGYNTIDVSNPRSIALITASNTTMFGWKHLVLNGSGLGVVATSPNFAFDGPHNISTYDVSNPSLTDVPRAEFPTPGVARAVAISNGLAYVADHNNGLQVVNYLAFDTNSVPPTISLGGSIDFSAVPTQVEEGKLVGLTAAVSDDVQVRSVEFYVDGEKIATDVNYPFEAHFTAPLLANQPSIAIRAVAFDTGGNSAATQERRVDLVPDSTAPFIFRVLPQQGAIVGLIPSIAVFVNEPLATESLTPANFVLLEAGPDGVRGTEDDAPVNTGTIEFQEDALAVFRSFEPPLSAGKYRATMTDAITDLAKNGISPAFSWDFEIFDAGVDTDSDGVPDSLESALGLDPNNADSDNDGTLDGQEDFDNDGLVNAAEVILNRDPQNPDTNGNQILDGDEDVDQDGLTDGQEVALGTNPSVRDTDGDGFLDGDEVANGSDPNDAKNTPIRFATSTTGVLNLSAVFTDSVGVASTLNLDASGIDLTVGATSVRNNASPGAINGVAESWDLKNGVAHSIPMFTAENTAP